jgi:hypothetical protein
LPRPYVPFPPHIRHYFLGDNQPYVVLLFPHLCPTFIYFKTVIKGTFRFYLVMSRFEYF